MAASAALLFTILARNNTGPGLNSASGAMAKFHQKAAVGFAGLAGTMGAFFTQGAKSLMRIETIGAQTDAVLRSTKGVAGVTRESLDALAGSIEGMTATEAESVTEGANLLLTFTNIRNAAGAGNDIFDQTTRIMTDMARAMGKDPAASAVMLGKALNDPVKGISALTKVGVVFTAEQKKAVEAMVKSGDVMGAQRVILAELNTEFGGSAQAFGQTVAGQAALAAHSWGTMQETLTAELMPAITAVVGEGLKFARWLEENPGKVKVVATVLGVLAGVLLASLVVMKLIAAAQLIAAAASAVWTGAMWLLNAAFLGNPIGLIVIAVAALAGAFVLAWKKSETFRDIVTGAWNMIVKGVGTAVKFLVSTFGNYVDFLLSGFELILKGATNVPFIGGKFEGALAAVQDLRANVSAAVDLINSELDRVVKTVQVDLNIVTHRYDAEEVGVGAAEANQILDEKAAMRAATQRRRAAESAVSVAGNAVAPKIDVVGRGGAAGGGGVAAAKEKADPHRIGIKFGKLMASGMADGLKDGGKGIGDKVKDLLARIKAKIDAAKDIANGIREAFRSAAAVTEIERGGSFRQLMDSLSVKLDHAKAYTDGVIRLRKEGLNKTSLDQIVAAGPEGGLAAIEQIVNGGRGAVAMLNATMAKIEAEGKRLGFAEAKARTGIDLAKPPDKAVLGSGKQKVVVEFDFSGAGDDALVKAIRKAIRVKGGNVQVALGSGAG